MNERECKLVSDRSGFRDMFIDHASAIMNTYTSIGGNYFGTQNTENLPVGCSIVYQTTVFKQGNVYFNINSSFSIGGQCEFCSLICKEEIAGVDCVTDEVATKATCTSACGIVSAVVETEASYGGELCGDYTCAPGDGECSSQGKIAKHH